VIVNLVSDQSSAMQGVVWAVNGRWITLRSVSMLKAGGAPTPVDGEIVVDRHNVAFMQVLP